MQCPHCKQQLPASTITPIRCPFCNQSLRGYSQPIELPDLSNILPPAPSAESKKLLSSALLQPSESLDLPAVVNTAANKSAPIAAPAIPFADELPMPISLNAVASKPIAAPAISFEDELPMPVMPAIGSSAPIAAPANGPIPASGLNEQLFSDLPSLAEPNDSMLLPDLGAIAGLTAADKASNVSKREFDDLPAVNQPAADFDLPDLSALVGLSNSATQDLPGIVQPAPQSSIDAMTIPDLQPVPNMPEPPSSPSFIEDLPLPAIINEPRQFNFTEEELAIPAIDNAPISTGSAPIAMGSEPIAPIPAGPAPIAMGDFSLEQEPEAAPIAMGSEPLAPIPAGPAPIAMGDFSLVQEPEAAPIAMDSEPLAPIPAGPAPIAMGDFSLMQEPEPVTAAPSNSNDLPLIPDITDTSLDLLSAPADLLPVDNVPQLESIGSIGMPSASETSAGEQPAASADNEPLDFAVEPTAFDSAGSDTSASVTKQDEQGNVILEAGSDVPDLIVNPNKPDTAATVPVVATAPIAKVPVNAPTVQDGQDSQAPAKPAKSKSSNNLIFGGVAGLLAIIGVGMEFVTPYGFFGYKVLSDSLDEPTPPPVVASRLPIVDTSTDEAVKEEIQQPETPVIPDESAVASRSIERLPELISELTSYRDDPAAVKPVLVKALLRGYATLGTSAYRNTLIDLTKDDTDGIYAAINAALTATGTQPSGALKELAKNREDAGIYNELAVLQLLMHKSYAKALPYLKAACDTDVCRDTAIAFLRQAPNKGQGNYMSVYTSLPTDIKSNALIRVMVARRLEKDRDLSKVASLLDGISLPQKELLPNDRNWLTMRDVNTHIVNGRLKKAQQTIKELLELQSSIQLQNANGDIAFWLGEYADALALYTNLATKDEVTDFNYQAKAWFAMIMAGDNDTTAKTLENVSSADKKLPQYILADMWFRSLSTKITKTDMAELTKIFNKNPEVTELAMNYRPLVDMMEESVLFASNKPWSSLIQTRIRQLEFYLKNKQPVKAKEVFTQLSPSTYHLANPVDLRNVIANYLISTGHASEAIEQIDPVMADQPEHPILLTTLGKAYAALGDHVNAATTYKKAAELQNKDFDLMLLTAREYLAAADTNEALSILNNLNDHYIGNEQVLFLLAQSWLNIDHNKARRYITEAIQKNPKNSRYYTILAICEQMNNRTNDAIKNLKQALQLDGSNHLALRKISEIALEKENYTEAIGYLEKLVKIISNDAQVYAMLASAYDYIDEKAKAINTYKTALRYAPTNDGFMISLAKLYQEQDKGSEAQKLYEQAIKVNPQNSEAYLQLGYFYKEQHRDNIAANMFKRYLEIAQDSEIRQDIEQEINDLTR